MRFVVVHKVTSYLMVMTSFIALFVSGELHTSAVLASSIGLVVSWFWESPRVDPRRFERVWNGLTLLMLSKTVLDLVVGEPVLITGAYFIAFLAVNKLFNRSASRDYLQLYVVSFLQMVAATALSTDLLYGVLFLFYIVFSTWTLILFHLKREMEENYLLKYGDSLQGRPVQVQRVLNSRKLVGPRFLMATSLVSLAVFLGSALFFFLFPRIGFRFFNQQRPGIAMAGFSDTLELGHFGVVKDDPTVVMRVEFEAPEDRFQLERYWRGIAFDHYDGRVWSKSTARQKRTVDAINRVSIGPDDRLVRQSIYLEPMESRVLFGLTRVRTLRLDGPNLNLPGRRRALQVDDAGDIYYEQADEIAFRYVVHSEPEGLPPGLLEMPLERYRAAVAQRAARGDASRYLQVPAQLEPAVAELAREVAGDAETVIEVVDRLTAHLRTAYGYTLNLGRDARRAPLEDFLFIQKQGHCEYFSTALVIMLRTLGIAARNVNGFHGGTWNRFGNYVAISQGDAHSWVEVYFPEEVCGASGECVWFDRWMTRDATPPAAGRQVAESAWARVMQYTDALRMRWYKYVIEYDLQQQVGALVSLRDFWRRLRGDDDDETQGEAPSGSSGDRRVWIGLGLLALLVGASTLLRRRAPPDGNPRSRSRQDQLVSKLYGEMLRLYGRRGVVKKPSMTAREFVTHLEDRQLAGLDAARALVDVYERARFAGEIPSPAEIASAREALELLERALAPRSMIHAPGASTGRDRRTAPPSEDE